MQSVFAMAPPMSLVGRLIVAGLGFALACSLSRLMVGSATTTRRMLISLCVVLAVVACSSQLGDDRAVLAFLAGAIGGAIAVPRTASAINLSRRRYWRLAAACLIVGPALGIALFGMMQMIDRISPLDQLYYFRVFLAVGSVAGLLRAGIVSVVGSSAVRHDA